MPLNILVNARNTAKGSDFKAYRQISVDTFIVMLQMLNDYCHGTFYYLNVR